MKKLLLLSLLATFSLVSAAKQASIQRLYVFGDSFSDNGAGYLDGNGPTAVAYLADNLGFRLYPAYHGEAADHSLDFAISGAQTGGKDGNKMGDSLLGYGMRRQVDDFAALVRSKKTKFHPARTLFFFAGGLNDGKLPTEETVDNLKAEIKTLYALGARHFAVAILPEAIPGFDTVSKRLNPALAQIPAQLRPELRGATIYTSQWGAYFDQVFLHPDRYGIKNTKDACAGRALFKQDATPCATPDDHFFYHAEHPSTAVHKMVGKMLSDELAHAH